MALHSRIKRINEELRTAIAMILMTELKDPRLHSGLVTVTNVAVAKDLHNAQVWVSVYGTEEDGAAALEALEHSRGFIRRLLADRIVLKYIPVLHFRLDTSEQYADKINRLLKKVIPPEETGESSERTDESGEKPGEQA
jgi:ribosome-binding factor A